MKNVVIAAYARSPFTPANKGALMTVRADDMTAQVVKALIAKSGIDANDIEDLILGCAFPEGEQGMNMARLIVCLAELPISIAGVTLNRFCGSSMQAIHFAAGAIQMNAGEAFVCAGVESMSRVPMGGFNYLPNPELYQRYPQAYIGMGETAENLATKYNISRIAQEEFALLSQQKAYMAQQQGLLNDEIITIVSQRGEQIIQDTVSACLPEIMGIGPVSATQKALQRANLSLADMGIVELNEAFSAQSLAVLQDLPIAAEKLNIDGGAIALGHPLGATGARITGKAASLLQRENKRYALATQCIGGGQGIATILEAVS
jgi:acetyl-CoA acyltransferase